MINTETELYYKPIEVLNRLKCKDAEMTKQQLAFLCGLIKVHKPKKIVEIGVAAGGTTAVILQCLSLLNCNTQMFSLDLSDNYYRDKTKKTGYLIEKYKKTFNSNIIHSLYTGKYSVEYLEKIGKDIDFLILDSVHSLPGELLDFLAFYPFLKLGSIVVLHDIALNHYSNNLNGFATKVIFDNVAAKKIIDIHSEKEFPNIGAFIVTEDTKKYINNVFSALTLTWAYLPDDTELILYRECYKKNYTYLQLKLYDMAVQLNKKTIKKQICKKKEEFNHIYRWIEDIKSKKVYIYGYGNYGKKLYELMQLCNISFRGYIISDEVEKMKCDETIYYLSEIKIDKEEVILIGVNSSLHLEILTALERKGIKEYIVPNDYVFEFIEQL